MFNNEIVVKLKLDQETEVKTPDHRTIKANAIISAEVKEPF